MVKFVIVGKNKNGVGNWEVYGTFDERADCYKYLNTLRTGCLGESVKFKVNEEYVKEDN